MEQKMTPQDIEELSEKMADWAESDDFFEAFKGARVRARDEKTVEEMNRLLETIRPGRPAHQVEQNRAGASPTVQFRIPPEIEELLERRAAKEDKSKSEVARQALIQYLATA
ncbi:ribbon-helix-helix protein, CopG family [Rothia aerolata]|uniref:ribbon-helix-helix protein, CopG family n=1 Tax=Rothia aerolata TaxID=1812262 RepID=UPI001662996B|nr:ribbon-helix-helix protein, CopG family [Rothia aerolata]